MSRINLSIIWISLPEFSGPCAAIKRKHYIPVYTSDAGRLKKSGVPVVIGWDDLHSPVGIGLGSAKYWGGAIVAPLAPQFGYRCIEQVGQWVRISNKENGTQESLKR